MTAPVEIKFLNRKKFNKAIRNYVKNFTDKQLIMFIKGLAMKILAGVVERTPVDTGFARNNWLVTRGSVGDETPYPAEDNVDGVLSREIGEIEQIAKMQDLKEIIYVWNAVPYIVYLETGSSDQAPEGMLRVTFAQIASELSSRFDFVGYYRAKASA